MNIKRKKIKVATSKEMVIFYDKKRTTINKNKLIYNPEIVCPLPPNVPLK